jgi:hypothetical protein
MTGDIPSNPELMERNFDKVRMTAYLSQVNSVLITGKGEPTKNWPFLCKLIKEFNEFPVELQTNGIYLSTAPSLLGTLHKEGLDVLAVSVNSIEEIKNFYPMFDYATNIGLTVRVTVNLVPEAYKNTFIDFVNASKEHIQQLSFRTVTVPKINVKDKEKAEWITTNVDALKVSNWLGDMQTSIFFSGKLVRELVYGATIYEYDGLSVTHFDYCIQDQNKDNDIRSLIFQENGHLYTTWSSDASRLY